MNQFMNSILLLAILSISAVARADGPDEEKDLNSVLAILRECAATVTGYETRQQLEDKARALKSKHEWVDCGQSLWHALKYPTLEAPAIVCVDPKRVMTDEEVRAAEPLKEIGLLDRVPEHDLDLANDRRFSYEEVAYYRAYEGCGCLYGEKVFMTSDPETARSQGYHIGPDVLHDGQSSFKRTEQRIHSLASASVAPVAFQSLTFSSGTFTVCKNRVCGTFHADPRSPMRLSEDRR